MTQNYRITLRAARVNAGLTLRDVSEISGKAVDTIQKFEKDSSNIPYSLKNFLVSLYNVPEEIVFFGLESDLIVKTKVS